MKKTCKVMAMTMAVLLLMGMVLTGCGGGNGGADPIVGKWSLSGVDLGTGTVIDLEEFVAQYGAAMDTSALEITFDIKADGTFVGNAMGETAEGTWEKGSGNEYTLTIEGEAQAFTLEDGKLVMEDSGMKLILSK